VLTLGQYAAPVAFLDGTNPVLGAAVVPKVPSELPIVVLVVEDADDDELVSVIAAATMVPAEGYGGAWAAQVTQGGLTIKFHLIRLDGSWERAWTLPDPPDEMLDATTGGAHYVAILPHEFAGELDELKKASLGGSIIIEAQPSESIATARGVG
jgi:hypothetical protein